MPPSATPPDPLLRTTRLLARSGVAAAFAAALFAPLLGCPTSQPNATAPATTARPTVRRSPTPLPIASPKVIFEVEVTAPAGFADGTTVGATMPWEPIPTVTIVPTYAVGNRAFRDVAPLTTGTDGKGMMVLPQPGEPIMLTATVGRRQLLRIYRATDGGAVQIDPASTLAAAYYKQLRFDGKNALARVDAARMEGVMTRIKIKLEKNPAGIDISTEAKAAASMESLIAADSILYNQVVAALGRTTVGQTLPTPTPNPLMQ